MDRNTAGLAPELLVTHVGAVRGLARRLVHGEPDVDDLVQDTLAKAIEAGPCRTHNPVGWLRSICRTAFLQERRADLRRRERERQAADQVVVRATIDVVEEKATVQAIADAVCSLPKHEFLVIRLRYFSDLKPSEIAERLELPLSTVKRRLERAASRLRQKLKVMDEGGGASWRTRLLALTVPSRDYLDSKTSWTSESSPQAELQFDEVLPDYPMGFSAPKMAVVAAAMTLCVVLVPGDVVWDASGADTDGSVPSDATARPQSAQGISPAALVFPAPASARRSLVPVAVPQMEGVRVRVRAQGVPASGTEIFWFDTLSLDYELFLAERAAGFDREEAAERRGRRFVADETGEAVVPVPTGYLALCARRDEWVAQGGFGHLREGESVTMNLRVSESLWVRVVDEDDELAPGVPVVLRERKIGFARTLLVARTDPSGRARLNDVLDVMRSKRADKERLAVGFGFPMRDPIDQEIDLDHLPEDPIELTLPPTGAVEIHLIDAAGQPVLEEMQVVLETIEEGQRLNDRDRLFPLEYLGKAVALSQGGRARFDRVGLGTFLAASAPVADTQNLDVAYASGPEQAGDLVEIEVGPTSRQRLLSGRLLLPDNTPVPRCRIRGVYVTDRHESGDWFREPIRVGRDGIFRIALSEVAILPSDLVLLVAQSNGDRRPLATVLHLAKGLIGAHDFGDLTLATAPLLVGGTVRLSDDRPAVGVELGVSIEMEYEGRRFPFPLRDLLGRSRSDGSFEIYGLLPGRVSATLSLGHAEATQRVVEFRPGTDDLDVALYAPAGLAGSVRLGPTLAPSDLRLIWSERGEYVAPEYAEGFVAPREDGEFTVTHLRAGKGVLQMIVFPEGVDLDHPLPPIWETSLELPAGGILRDSRLDDIDLRGFHFYRLDVRAESGEALPAVVRSIDQTSLRFGSGGGVLRVPAWIPQRDWIVSCRGHQSIEVRDLDSDQSVTLSPALSVQLVLSSEPPPMTFVSVRGQRVDSDGVNNLWSCLFWNQVETTAYLQSPGTYRLRVQLGRVDDPNIRHDFGDDAGIVPSQIEVTERDTDQTFEIHIPTRALERARAALDGR